MKLSIRNDSTNYAAQIIKLPTKQPVAGLDNLVKVTFQGNDVLTKKDTDENILYIFFPVECEISTPYLSWNNEYRNTTMNTDNTQKGYFEDSGRVKAIKFKGVISTGYIAPLDTLKEWVDITQIKVGDEFTTIDGWDVCKKYKPARQQSTKEPGEGRNKADSKLLDYLVKNQFKLHQETSHLAKNLHLFNPDDIIVITDKWHGSSVILSKVLIKKPLTLWQKVLNRIGGQVPTTQYGYIYSSGKPRSGLPKGIEGAWKNTNKDYYSEDIWATLMQENKEKLEDGITLYGEVVGYTQVGKAIQKGYTYGCENGVVPPHPEHKFLVYRITYTKPDGNTIEFSWNQIKEYCAKYSIETVKQLWFGPIDQWCIGEGDNSINNFFNNLVDTFLEKDCPYNKPKTPAEGIVVRLDGKSTYSAYKLKSKRFLEGESKALDKGEVGIEEESV